MINKGYLLDDLLDQCFIYSILCYKSHVFYNRLKYMFQFPIIISSSIMSLINSNLEQTDPAIKIVNISFNIFTALMLAINNNLKFEARSDTFKAHQNKFIKMQHDIEKHILNNELLSTEFLNSLVEKYDSIVESINYDIPSYILNDVRNTYKEKKTLPIIINGIKKRNEYRDQDVIEKFSKDDSKTGSLKNFNMNNLKTNINSDIVFDMPCEISLDYK